MSLRVSLNNWLIIKKLRMINLVQYTLLLIDYENLLEIEDLFIGR